MKPLISIIIPVYNSEKYLVKCLDSVTEQTFADFEVLLINDGSTDKSGIICDEYAAKDSRFKIFHKENGGVSSARNLGIEKATGDWICFVDSDDYLGKEFLFSFKINIQSNCDFYLQSADQIKKSKKSTFYKYSHSIYSPSKFFNIFSLYPYLSMPWSKLFRLKIIISNNLRFDSKLARCEDMIFNLQYLSYIDCVKTIQNTGYIYRKEDNSLSSKIYPTTFYQEIISRMKIHFKELLINDSCITKNISYQVKNFLNSIYLNNYKLKERIMFLKYADNHFHNELLYIFKNGKGRGRICHFLLKKRLLWLFDSFYYYTNYARNY